VAEVDVLAEIEHAGHDVLDALVDEGLASADRHHRRGALCTCIDALLHGEPGLVRLVLGIFPQPMQAMLHASVGSSIRRAGTAPPCAAGVATYLPIWTVERRGNFIR